MKLIEIKDIPQMSTGAPSPTIIADDNNLYVSYYKALTIAGKRADQVITLRFLLYAHFNFGAPSAETISGHRYYKFGLESYAVFELLESDLIEKLRQVNKVHPYHDDKRFDSLKHYIITYHDRTFECVAEGCQITETVGKIALAPALRALIGC